MSMIESKLTELSTSLGNIHNNFSKFKSRYDGRLDEVVQTLAQLQEPSLGGFEGSDGRSSPGYKAFGGFLRRGENSLGPDERKVLTVADNPSWGYLCPPQVANTIIKGIAEFSPVRQIANVVTVDRESLEIPKKTASGTAAWVAETGTRSEVTGLAYGLEKIVPYEMYYLAKATVKSLEDAAYDVEAELAQEFADAFGVLEGEAFINGTGAEQPEGLLTNASVTTYNSEVADDISADAVLALPFQIKSGYLPGARYLLNRTSLWKIRTFKDAVSGVYLWQPAISSSTPATICGFPYTLCPELDDPDTNKYPILFGNFPRAYTVVDRVGMSIQRLAEKYAEYGQVGFLARRRVGGQVVLAEAIVKMKCAVT